MSKVALVTDSTACIPKDLMQKYQISVAPQVLVWGEETFLDGVDIQPDEYYIRLRNSKIMPTTSQASPQSFNDIYSHLLEEGYEVLTILLSAQLSGTLISAQQALENFPGAPVEIIDSYTVAMAMGFQVLAAPSAVVAARMVRRSKVSLDMVSPVTVVRRPLSLMSGLPAPCDEPSLAQSDLRKQFDRLLPPILTAHCSN